MEALKNVWEGAIPLQIHLHESEVTTLPPPSPALILAPRIGYLPLLVPQIKPHFSGALPPGADTVWFDYRGLPLKWNIPTGVLFDLLCVEPERPWNLTVHFRGYPGNILVPWEGEDSVKWSFINSLKEASYITLGNCKNIMNMSQPDQVELWRTVLNSMSGNLEAYLQVSSKLKLGTVGDEYAANLNPCSSKSRQSIGDMDGAGQVKTGRVPVRLYVRRFTENFDDLEDAPQIDNWDKISYINRPVEIHGEEGKCFTLLDAVKDLLPEYFTYNSFPDGGSSREEGEDELKVPSEGEEKMSEHVETCCPPNDAEVTLVRIQGIEPKLEIPFSWVVSNLRNPEYFLHVCVFLKVPQVEVL